MFLSSTNPVCVMINSFHTKTNVFTGKSFTVYDLEIIYGGKAKLLERRYSEFYSLYRKLNKLMFAKANFPPKHVLNRDRRLLESRRTGLESYLQAVLVDCKGNIPVPLSDFLELDDGYRESCEYEDKDYNDSTDANMYPPVSVPHHQPMISFRKDIFLEATMKEAEDEIFLPSIVTKGTLSGIYSLSY